MVNGCSFRPILSLLILSITAHSSSISSFHDYNRFLVAHAQSANPTTWGSYPINNTYISTFTDTIQPAANVYYSTQSICAYFVSSSWSSSTVKIKYKLQKDFVNTTTLQTRISGYFDYYYFNYIGFRYLLVMPATPWLSDYMVIAENQFTQGGGPVITPLPTKYVLGNTLSRAVLIKDIWLEYPSSNLGNKLSMNWTASISATDFTMSFICSPYVISYTVNYLVIIIDSTALAQDYPQYRFLTNYWTGSSSLYNRGLSFSVSYKYQNYVFGFSNFTINTNSNSDLYFSLNAYSYTLNLYFYGNTWPPISFTYAYAVFPYYSCASSAPSQYSYYYYNTTDHQCYDSCPQFQFLDPNRTCSPCRFDCLSCYDSTRCSSCNSTYRSLQSSNLSCIPLDGFYESNAHIPSTCDPICKTCIGTSTFCTSCPTNTTNSTIYFTNNTCVNCSNLLEGCSTCNISYCFSCTSPYRLINAHYCNLPCNDINCAVCSNADLSFCFTCKTQYFTVDPTGWCVASCGDGFVRNTQICDDGNDISHDGCNSYCKPQPYYQCYNGLLPNGINYTLYCAYTHPIEFTVVSLQKIDYVNKISIVISVSQYLQTFWKTRSVLSYCFVQTPIPYRNMQVSFMSADREASSVKLLTPVITSYTQASLMKLSFEYLSPIQGQNINLSFNFSSATDLALVQIPPYNVAVAVIPQNNLAAHLYTQKTYQSQKMLANFFVSLSIAALVLLLVSFIIGGKRIIVEMLTIFQVTFISLISAPLVTPMLSSVTSLSVANNGYNVLSGSAIRAVDDTLSDERVKGMLMYSQFLFNFNTGILFILVPLLVGIVAAIISKIGDYSESRRKKIQNFYRSALGEYVYVGLIFTSCIIGGSAAIEIKFGMVEIGTMIGLLSLVFTGVLLVFYPIYMLIRMKLPQCFEQYNSIINKDRFSLAFQLFYFLLGLILGGGLCAFCKFSLINCVAAGIPFGLFLIVLFKPIFKKQLDHYRTQLNLLTLTLIQIPFFYANAYPALEYSSESDLSVMMPMLLGLLLFLNFLINLCFFVYVAVKKWREAMLLREKLRAKDGNGEQESVRQEQIEQLYKNSLINPLACLKQGKFVDGFIEYSEKDPEEVELKEIIKKNQKRSISNNPQSLPQKAIILDSEYIHNNFAEIDQL